MRHAKEFAERLEHLGARRERVVVCLPNSIDSLIAMVACWMSDAIYVPLTPAQAASQALQRQLNPYLLIAPANFVEFGDGVDLKSVGSICTVASNEDLACRFYGSSRQLSSDYEAHPEGDSYSTAIPLDAANDEQLCGGTALSACSSAAPSDSEAVVLCSSGTTGAPKCVAHGYDALIRHARLHAHRMNYSADDVSLVVMQMDRAFCLTSQILPALFNGVSLHIHTEFHPEPTRHAIEQDAVTLIYGYPDYFHKISSAPVVRSSLRAGVAGGELSTVATIRNFGKVYGAPLVQSIGMIETLAYSLNTSSNPSKFGSAGTSHDGVSVYIRDEIGRNLPSGSIGQICVKSPLLLQRYLGRPCWREEVFETGDAGMIDDEGFLWLLGRMPLSKRYAEARFAKEILYQCPFVKEAEVSEDASGELVALVVLLSTAAEKDVSDLIAQLSLSYNCRVKAVASLPRLPSGKLDRSQILLR